MTKREKQARKKAEFLVSLTQGTMQLESQGLDQSTLDELVEETVQTLLEGPEETLWA